MFEMYNRCRYHWPLWIAIALLTSLVCIGFFALPMMVVQGQEGPQSPDATGTISGIVTNADSQPLGRVQVTAYQRSIFGEWLEEEKAITDDTGAYKILYLRTGTYRLEFLDLDELYQTAYFRDASYISSATDIPVAATDVTGIDQTLESGGRITGTIQLWNGEPPREVFIVLYKQSGVELPRFASINHYDLKAGVITYSFSRLEPGTYRLSADARYRDVSYLEYFDDVITFHEASDLVVAPGVTMSDVNLVLGATSQLANVSGTVRSADGAPLPNIQVSALITNSWGWGIRQTQRTDSAGRYELRSLRPDDYIINFADAQRIYADEFYSDTFKIADATVLRLMPDTTTRDIDAQLTWTGGITGTIAMYNGESPHLVDITAYLMDGEHIEEERIYYSAGGYRGHYQMNGLTPGTYRLRFRAYYAPQDYLEYYRDALSVDTATDVPVVSKQLTTDINVVLGEGPEYAQILGTVTSSTGVGLSDIEVTATFDSYREASTNTDEAGNFRIQALAPNTYTLQFKDNQGLYPLQFYSNTFDINQATQIVLRSGEVVSNVNMELKAGGVITGILTLYNGSIPDRATIRLYRQEGGQWSRIKQLEWRQRDDLPYYSFAGLLSDIYRVGAIAYRDDIQYPMRYYLDSQGIGNATNISVTLGSTSPNIDIVFQDKTNGRIEGLVFANGAVLPDASVELHMLRSGYSNWWQYLVTVQTNETGSYAIGGLAAGKYRICVLAQNDIGPIRNCHRSASSVDDAHSIILQENEVINLNLGLDWVNILFLPAIAR
jgi:hypothetical protein